jgi:cation transport ATPase
VTLVAVHTTLCIGAMLFGTVVIHEFRVRDQRLFAIYAYLVAAVLATGTGFLFPFKSLQPPHVLGVLSTVVLIVAVVAFALALKRANKTRQVVFRLAIVVSLFFLYFAGVAELFIEMPALKALAPTLTESPFWAAELVLFLVFLGLGYASASRWRQIGSTP